VEDLLGEAERRLVTGELPDNDGLVCGGCQQVTLSSISVGAFPLPLPSATHRARR
jgi:hypothetical protein